MLIKEDAFPILLYDVCTVCNAGYLDIPKLHHSDDNCYEEMAANCLESMAKLETTMHLDGL